MESHKRFHQYESWSEQTPGGKDQYALVVNQASRVYNKEFYGDNTQHMMPGSHQKIYPITFFMQPISRVSAKQKEPEHKTALEF